MKKFCKIVLILLGLMSPSWAELPQGWDFFTTTPSQYRALLDTEVYHQGRASGGLVSQGQLSSKRHAVLLQKIAAQEYRSHRVRISGYISSKEVTGRTGIWIRIDDKQGQVLGFENMADQPISGNTPWTKVSLEIDIPVKADEIHFGLLLTGMGQANLDDLEFTILGPSQPSRTVRRYIRALPTHPVNLEFER